MTLTYDVVVLGAGPAGSTTAFHAASGGRRTLLVERSTFPRDKTCGDAVSPRGVAALGRLGVADTLGWQVRGAHFVRQPDGADWYEDFRTHDGRGWGCVVRRAELDERLLDAARGAGAEHVTAVARDVAGIAGRGHAVTLDVGGARVRVETAAVVIATGSRGIRHLVPASAVAPAAGWGIAARGYFAAGGATGRALRIFFPVRAGARLFAGYVWAFPASDRCWNIGIGLFRSPHAEAISLRALLGDFLRTVGPRVGLGDVRPLGSLASAPIAIAPLLDAGCGLLAVGDAAGVANPFTGEGIAAALESGELAGRLLAADLESASERYARDLARLLPGRGTMRPALRAMYENPGLFLGRGADAVTAPRGLVGGALRRLVWDTVPRRGALPTGTAAPAGLARMCAVIDALVTTGRRMRPLFGELLAGIIADPHSGIGLSTAFAIGAAASLASASRPSSAVATGLLSVLEMVTAVAALHRDLLPPERHPGGGAWGRNTAGLALADTLTAEALRRLYACEARVAVPVAAVARRYLRAAAAAPAGADGLGDRVPLLLAGAAVAAGCPGAALPPWVCDAARRVSPGCQTGMAVVSAADRLACDVAALVAAWRRALRVPEAACI